MERNNNLRRSVSSDVVCVRAWQEGFSALHRASEAGHVDVVRLLVEKGANINDLTGTGFTALCLAAKGGHEATVRFLATAGANIETADVAYGCSPLLWAVQNGTAQCVDFLCVKGADKEAKSRVSVAFVWRYWSCADEIVPSS